jgi:hypothetical protein
MLSVNSNINAVAQVDTGANINTNTLVSGFELDGLRVGGGNGAHGGREDQQGRSKTHDEEMIGIELESRYPIFIGHDVAFIPFLAPLLAVCWPLW